MEYIIKEVPLSAPVLSSLLAMSADWAKEGNVYGYAANEPSDIEGNRIFLAYAGDMAVGYAFGHGYRSKNMGSVMPEDTACFEVEELYVAPEYRSRGIGRKLLEFVQEAAEKEYDFLTLTTATKNHRAILHFYIDEIGMEFWSARLYKPLGPGKGAWYDYCACHK